MASKILTMFFVALISISLSAIQVYADSNTYKLLEPIGSVQQVQSGSPDNSGSPSFSGYMREILRVGIAAAGILAVVELVIGGIQYIFASANEKQATAAKDRIENAIIGLIIGVSSILILNTINPDILAWKLKIPPIGSSATNPSTQ